MGDNFEKALEKFTSKEDQELLKRNREIRENFEKVASLHQSPEGRALLGWVRSEIMVSVRALLNEKDIKHAYTLESYFNLYTYLTDSKSQIDAIDSWLESVINKDG